MAIPTILKGDTSAAISFTAAPGPVYTGMTLTIAVGGATRTFTNITGGATMSVTFTADETAKMPLGTNRVEMALTNAAGRRLTLPWAKILVTDAPAEVNEGGIYIDPRGIDVDDATAADSLGAVKSKLNEVLAFLRGGAAALAVLFCLAATRSDAAQIDPLYTTLNDAPGTTPVMTNTVAFVTNAITERAITRDSIVDALTSTATNAPLSANMGRELESQILNLKQRGRYLSIWNATNGLAETTATVTPYTYKAGDYFIVGTVAAAGGTNYRPSGSAYTNGVPSRVVEAAAVRANDTYYYDGSAWTLVAATFVETDPVWTAEKANYYAKVPEVNFAENEMWTDGIVTITRNTFGVEDTYSGYETKYGAQKIYQADGLSNVEIEIPQTSGTLALTSQIPTSLPWSAITGKPDLAAFVRTNALTGTSYDFATNRDIIRATADLVRALGGTVVNDPTGN